MERADEGSWSAAPEISGVMLRVLADVALHYGVTPAQLFQDDAARLIAGEPMQVRIPFAELGRFAARAIALTGEAGLGLRCGLTASDAAFDLFAPLVAHVPSLRHAVREASQFSALVVDGGAIHLSEGSGVARLTWELPSVDCATDRFIDELAAAGIVRMLRSFGGGRDDLRTASFRHRRPARTAAYADVFNGTERFAAEQSYVEFGSHLLDRPHLHFNPSLQRLVHAQAEERLARLARPLSLLGRVRMLLLHSAAPGVPDMAVAARQLGVSVRSLRRHLAEEGVSYRALTQELQHERARAMLRDPALTLQAISDGLGFTDMVAFHRAFKRWSGITPGAYRASLRASAA